LKKLQTAIKYQEIPKFPAVRRDLALLVSNTTQYQQLHQLAFATEKKLLKQVSLFDVYEGKNLPEGKKSYALSFQLQDEEKTLTDEQIEKSMEKILKAYEKELSVTLR
jgi:phenylalanyl-tRNA synthetase beta chain